MTYFLIRPFVAADTEAILRIAWQDSAHVGFVRRDRLAETFVAEYDGTLAGFINFHTRRDGWSRIYHLAVHRAYRGRGIGRALLYSVPCPLRLTTIAGAPSNAFYTGAGLSRTGERAGRKHRLYDYELRLLPILVRGGRRGMAALARAIGAAYGTRHDVAADGWPFMLDVHWQRLKERPGEWQRVLRAVETYHPVAVMTQDWEEDVSADTIHAQVADLRARGVLRIMICPKREGILPLIPMDCIVAVSVPSAYAGYLPKPSELAGRRVHLLGGTPQRQKELLLKYAGHGARVISFDGNSFVGAASKGTVYADGRWRKAKSFEAVDIAAASLYSGQQVRRELERAARYAQMPLWTDL